MIRPPSRTMWNQVGAETDFQVGTQAWLRSWEDMGWDPADQAWLEPGAKVLDFSLLERIN